MKYLHYGAKSEWLVTRPTTLYLYLRRCAKVEKAKESRKTLLIAVAKRCRSEEASSNEIGFQAKRWCAFAILSCLQHIWKHATCFCFLQITPNIIITRSYTSRFYSMKRSVQVSFRKIIGFRGEAIPLSKMDVISESILVEDGLMVSVADGPYFCIFQTRKTVDMYIGKSSRNWPCISHIFSCVNTRWVTVSILLFTRAERGDNVYRVPFAKPRRFESKFLLCKAIFAW